MKKPRALIFSGYGLNCEEETQFAFVRAGAAADIVHVNDLIDGSKSIADYDILAFPGGFSYGDDTGSGKAYANRLKNHLWDDLQKFVREDKLVIGICNGFQILTHLGLLPGALTFNDDARFVDRWVDLKVSGESPWLDGVSTLMAPIAHGEGKYVASAVTHAKLKADGSVGARYVCGEACENENLNANPNGSHNDIACVTQQNGRVLGMMPHPERALFFTQLPHWPLLKEQLLRARKKIPEVGPGQKIFDNGVKYFLKKS